MVDFSTKTTGMSDVNALGIKQMSTTQGVADMSTATAIKGFGNMAVEAYQGYQLADLEKQQEQNIQDYMAGKEGSQAAVEAGQLRTGIDKLWEGFDTSIDDVNILEKRFQEKLGTYKRAVDQGIMTPDQLADRILATTREAINRNPGMYQELKQHAAKVMEMSGITNILEMDKKTQKQQQDNYDRYLKDLDDRLQKNNIYYDYTTPIWAKEKMVFQAEADARNYETFKRSKDYKGALTSEQAIQWLRDNGTSNTRGAYTEFGNTILSLAEQAGTNDYPKIKGQVELQANMFVRNYIDNIPPEIRNDPSVKEHINVITKDVDSLVKSFANIASGEDFKKLATNQLETLKAMQSTDLHRKVPVEQVRLIGDMLKFAPEAFIQNSGIRQNTIDTISMLMQGTSSPVSRDAMPSNIKDKKYADILSMAAKAGKDSKDFSGLSTLIDTSNKLAAETVDPAKRHVFLSNNIEALSKADLTGMSVTDFSKVNQMIGTFMNDPSTGVPNMTKLMEQYGTKLDVLPDGRMLFIGNMSDEFNSKYGSKMNMALQAYANAQNTSTKEAAKTFYPSYFSSHPEVLSDPDLSKTKAELRKGEVAGKITLRISPEEQKGRDDKALQILYQERADQTKVGKVDKALEKEIADREKKLGITK